MELQQHRASTGTPRGTVLITHGYAEHSGRYQRLVETLNAADYDVVAFDLPGHGTTPGPRARVDVGRLIAGHPTIRRRALEEARTPDLFLYGHSMGGAITAASTLLDPSHLRGTVLTGPALRPSPHVPVTLARALLPLARLAPWAPSARLDSRLISRSPSVVRAYLDDPLVTTGPVPLLTGITMTVQGDQVIRNAASLRTPTLIIHGGADALAGLDGSREFVEATRDVEIQLRVVDGAYHEVLNEPEGPALMQDIIMWLDRH
ncbi:alpha/beta hydrolase [Schaalia naturae]|uniref:Alpha/beta hydrolase n=1 Tax=Schaalia naturae TaxID=635203 RepID=A0ABW2SHR6_9ACTO